MPNLVLEKGKNCIKQIWKNEIKIFKKKIKKQNIQ